MSTDVAGQWAAAEYPYDNAGCGGCVTTHGIRETCNRKKAHQVFIRAAKKLVQGWKFSYPTTPEQVEAVTKLRKRFTRFYPKRKKTTK